ncbi:respiratory chain complex I subunit 1 family protein [Rosettibacter firmus]|uniref:respiratory chain complex I subunit 1 family protein n=1 Tax=Rosettibacter firmus TaxID=3111522 RepID=UPI00336C2117
MVKIIIYIFLIISPFFFVGIINRVKALWAGRKGTPILQAYYDFLKLLQKGEVISKTTSFIFRLTPSINVASMLIALLIIPIPLLGSIIKFPADFVLFSYILGFSKFMTVLAALDTGSSFEGMGASREATFSTISETAFFIIIGTLALLTNRLSFESIFLVLNLSSGYTALVKILLVISIFIMLLAEGSRIPVDDPNTHLELTMIHEVMILDYSGPDLALINYAASLKMLLFSMLISNLLVPPSLSLEISITLFLLLLVLIFMTVGLIESLIARIRMSHVPQFIFVITAFSITAFAIVMFFLRGGY